MEGQMTINHFIGQQMEKALAWDAFYAAMSKSAHGDREHVAGDRTFLPVAYEATGVVAVMEEALESVKAEVEAEAHPGLCFLCGGKHTP